MAIERQLRQFRGSQTDRPRLLVLLGTHHIRYLASRAIPATADVAKHSLLILTLPRATGLYSGSETLA